MKVDSKVGMAREGDEMWRRPLGQGRCGLGDLGLGGAVEGRDDWVSPGRSLFEAGSRCDCLLQRVCLPTRSAAASPSHGAPLPPVPGFPDARGCHPGTAGSKGL